MRDVGESVWAAYEAESGALSQRLSEELRTAMASLVGSRDAADLLLISADNQSIPAHLCVVKQRAPGFYRKYIASRAGSRSRSTSPQKSPRGASSSSSSPRKASPRASSGRLEVRLADVDAASLRFFLQSIYTDDEVAKSPREALVLRAAADHSSSDERDDTGEPGSAPSRASSRHTYVMEMSVPEDDGGLGDNTENIEPAETDDSELQTAPLDDMEELMLIFEESPPLMDKTQPLPIASATLPRGSTSFQEMLKLRRSESQPEIETMPHVHMTSFRELAFESPLVRLPERLQLDDAAEENEENYSPDSVTQFPLSSPEEETCGSATHRITRHRTLTETIDDDATYPISASLPQTKADKMVAKFIHFEEIASSSDTGETPSERADRKIFPYFVQFDSPRPVVQPLMLQSDPMTESDFATGPRVRSKRTSIGSIRSLESIDISPAQETPPTGAFPPNAANPCSNLGADLLEMFDKELDTDLIVVSSDGTIKAHRSILVATCPYFAEALGRGWLEPKTAKLELKAFSKAAVRYALAFLYGGLTAIAEDVDVWELLSLADLIQMESLRTVVRLHIKAKLCHFFHRPCAGCLSGVLANLRQMEAHGLDELARESVGWVSQHFARVWKSRLFAQLPDDTQRSFYRALVERISPESVVDVLLGCEKLRATLPRTTRGGAPTEQVKAMAANLNDCAADFLSANFDHVITSKAFLNQGKGMALNLGLLEDLLPGVIHSLEPDTGCRVLVRLYELLVFLTNYAPKQSYDPTQAEPTWNHRFTNLIRRLYELCDTQLIHSAAAVVRCDSWKLLNADMQRRIKETGIFVEMQKPRAPPPRLSSLNRSYKRSASSVSAQYTAELNSQSQNRARSKDRTAAGDRSQHLTPSPKRRITEEELSPAKTKPVNAQPPPSHSPTPPQKVTTTAAKPPTTKQIAQPQPLAKTQQLKSATPQAKKIPIKSRPKEPERPTSPPATAAAESPKPNATPAVVSQRLMHRLPSPVTVVSVIAKEPVAATVDPPKTTVKAPTRQPAGKGEEKAAQHKPKTTTTTAGRQKTAGQRVGSSKSKESPVVVKPKVSPQPPSKQHNREASPSAVKHAGTVPKIAKVQKVAPIVRKTT